VTKPDTNHPQQQRIVIAGNGLPAWMAAAVLAHAVNEDDYAINVLAISETDTFIQPFAYADATLPSPHKLLPTGLNENQIIDQSKGSFTHGIALSGWANPDSTYFHPFGSIGAALGPVSFHQIVLRLRHQGMALRLANFSLSALAAQMGKFVPAINDPRSVLATCEHGLHLDCNALATGMHRQAEAAGVLSVKGTFGHAEYDSEGDISALVTNDGLRVEGDLFIDCTGSDALLAGADANWHDWSAWLPCDHLVSAIIRTNQSPVTYSHNDTFEAGWIQHLPMQGRTWLNGLYKTDSNSENRVLDKLLQSSGSDELQPVYSGPLRFGRRTHVWHRNCIALGTAAALIDPVGISNLQLLMTGINHLLPLLPANRETAAVSTEYNRQMALQLDHARDFAILHYKLNGRRDEPFWDSCRMMPLPEELAYKLDLYQSRGRVALYDEEPLEETSWLNLFDEHGVNPREYSTIADGFGLEDLQKHLHRVRTVMMAALPKIPSHADYLAHIEEKPGSADKATGYTR
jgi:tryptophan halogenase